MKQQKKIYRAAAAVSTMAVSAALLTGCSTGTASPEGESLTFAYGAAGTQSTWETMTARYSAESGVKINVEPIALEAYASTLNTRLQAGSAPDLFLTEPGENGTGTGLVTLAQAGLLGEVTGAATDLISSTDLDIYGVQGKVYGFPLYNAPRTAVVINETLAGAGLKFPDTIEEMLTQCKTLREQGKSFTIGQFGTPFTADGPTILLAAGDVYAKDPEWDQKRANGQVTFAQSGWRDSLQTVVDMYHAGCFPDGAEAAGPEYLTAIIAGETPPIVAFTGGSSDVWKNLSDSLPKNTFSVDPFPAQTAADRRVINSVKSTLSSNAASKNPEAIQHFIDWLAKPENLQEIAELTGGVPAGKLEASTLPAEYKPLEPFIQADKVISQPGLRWPGTVLRALQEGVPGLLTGQKTIDQVLADMDTAWTQ